MAVPCRLTGCTGRACAPRRALAVRASSTTPHNMLRRAVLLSTLLAAPLSTAAAGPLAFAASAASLRVPPPLPDNVPTLLHAVLSVANLNESASFFCDAYGFSPLRSRPGNAFVGFGSESRGAHFSLELQPLPEPPPGEAAAPAAGPRDPFGGLVLAVANPSAAEAKALAAGASRASTGRCSGDAYKGCAAKGPEGVRVRFARDTSSSRRADAVARVVLRVASLPDAVAFYTAALGMAPPSAAGRNAFSLSEYAAEDENPSADVESKRRAVLGFPGAAATGRAMLELHASDAPLAPTSAVFDKIAIGVPNLQAAFDAAAAFSPACVIKPPFAVPGVGTRVALIKDPDGHTLALVDAADFEKELAPPDAAA